MIVIYLIYFLIAAFIIYAIGDILIPIARGTEPFSMLKKKNKNIVNVSKEEKDIFDKE